MPYHVGVVSSARPPWTRLTFGLVLVFLVFDRAGAALGSGRGEAGGLLALLVVALLVLVEAVLFGRGPRAALRGLGLRGPAGRGVVVAAVLSVALAALMPLCARVTGTSLVLLPGWPRLLPGLFLQHGIAEETLFRGYLFGQLREGHPFWPAAWRAMVPFAAAHAWLFLLMPAPVAAAATGLAVLTSFPLARLYEAGGRTIWAPALVHTAINAVKLVDLNGPGAGMFAAAWMACSALVPFLAFAEPASPRSARQPY